MVNESGEIWPTISHVCRTGGIYHLFWRALICLSDIRQGRSIMSTWLYELEVPCHCRFYDQHCAAIDKSFCHHFFTNHFLYNWLQGLWKHLSDAWPCRTQCDQSSCDLLWWLLFPWFITRADCVLGFCIVISAATNSEWASEHVLPVARITWAMTEKLEERPRNNARFFSMSFILCPIVSNPFVSDSILFEYWRIDSLVFIPIYCRADSFASIEATETIS